MGLSNELSCEAGSFSCHMNPHRFFQSEVLRLYFPHWNCALLGLSQLFLLVYPHTNLGLPSPLYTTLTTPVLQLLPCYDSSLPQLPISAPPTSLDESFFFNSLVVGLPYSLIFCQFWLFFVFKLVFILLLFVRRGKVYLPMPPSWLEVRLVVSNPWSLNQWLLLYFHVLCLLKKINHKKEVSINLIFDIRTF